MSNHAPRRHFLDAEFVQAPPPHNPETSATRLKEFTEALRGHLYRAKLIVYSLLLVVGVTQIIIRERFPELHPPWPLIGYSLMAVVFGVVFLPPLFMVIRSRKKAMSDEAAKR